MSYSNRRSHRPDPTIAPVVWDPDTNQLRARMGGEPSAYTEAKHLKSKAGKKAARARERQTLRASHR
jgi:hypothetical protein